MTPAMPKPQFETKTNDKHDVEIIRKCATFVLRNNVGFL